MLSRDRIEHLTKSANALLEATHGKLKTDRPFLIEDRHNELSEGRSTVPYFTLEQTASLGGLHTELCALALPKDKRFIDTPFGNQVGVASPSPDREIDWVFVECRYPF